MSSVRRTVLFGAMLWTFGMLAAFSVVLTYHHPFFDSFRVIHAHAPMMGLLAIVSMAAGALAVRAALAPLGDIRRNLSAVKNGSDLRVSGTYPTEVQPLVDDLNALLAHLETVVARAGTKAGDLAHGLKTPLTVLSNEADRLAAAGQSELAGVLTEQINVMRRSVEYHLAHARAAASGAAVHARSSVIETVHGLVRTMRQLHADRPVSIDTSINPRHLFKGRREDLDEMVGNLLDNACKWARTHVSVTSSLEGGRLGIIIDDDGPGIELAVNEIVLRRGVRRDERVPGSGLGLAIVRDLADMYGGTISLDRSAAGGVRARLEVPGDRSGPQPEEGIIRPTPA